MGGCVSTNRQGQKPPLPAVVPTPSVVRPRLFGENIEFVVKARGDDHSVPLFVTLAVEYLTEIGAFLCEL